MQGIILLLWCLHMGLWSLLLIPLLPPGVHSFSLIAWTRAVFRSRYWLECLLDSDIPVVEGTPSLCLFMACIAISTFFHIFHIWRRHVLMAKITSSLAEPLTVGTIPALTVRIGLVVHWGCLMVLHVSVGSNSRMDAER